MSERGLRQVDILEACQPYCQKYNTPLKKNDLSQYVSGKVEPRQDKLSILGMALKVNEAWLMGYDVPMVDEAPEPTLDEQLEGVEFALWGEVQDLSDDEKQDILDFIKFKKSQRK